MSENLPLLLRLACSHLGVWKPEQMCRGLSARVGDAFCRDCGASLADQRVPHEKPPPKLDDTLAMWILRELSKRDTYTHLTERREDWLCELWTPEARAKRVFSSGIMGRSTDPAEAIVMAVASLAGVTK